VIVILAERGLKPDFGQKSRVVSGASISMIPITTALKSAFPCLRRVP